nr:transposase (putative), gypsy type [Tanacetum cinerariifolium]
MSAVTDVRCALTQEALDAFCNTFHIPKEVHPVLPNQDDTMHEWPVGKIRLYTRFFDFANFRWPLSTFLVDILRHFRINISQLSVIWASKVSHFEILCRVYGIVPTVGLFRGSELGNELTSCAGSELGSELTSIAGAAGYGGARNRVGYANPGQARQIKCYNCNGIGHIVKNRTQPKRPQNSEYFKDKMLLMQAQENGVALDEEQLLFIAGGQDNVVDDDVDEQPIQDLALNTMFMANLSSADPVYDEVSPSYDSNILSEVHDHDHYQDAACEHHEEHEMHDDVQPTYVVDSHANYMHDSDMIPYDQYIKDKAVLFVQNDVSFVPNDAYMMILNDMHEQPNQCVSGTTQNTVVDKSLTAELAIYKEQV